MRLGTSITPWVLLLGIAVRPVTGFTSPSLPFAVRGGSRRTGRLEASPSATDVVAAAPSRSRSATLPDEPTAPTTTFTSPTFRVYIEDTDAYGVMYNSNYLRSYERALSHVPREEPDDDDEAPSRRDEVRASNRWVLSHISDQKFRSSPALGEEYVVRGELVGPRRDLRGNEAEVWRLEMATRSVDGPDEEDEDKGWTIHNSATATFACAPGEHATAPSAPFAAIRPDDEAAPGRMFELRFTPYHDEFDVHRRRRRRPDEDDILYGYHIPLRNAMNFFERSRSTYLGGPDSLRRMQEEDDLVWVVTGVDGGELLLDPVAVEDLSDDGAWAPWEGDDAARWHPAPGREVIVQTNFFAKRRGMIVECRHRLCMDVSSNNGRARRRLLARATVTIMALRGSTRRPTSKLPQWILDRFV